MNTRRNANQPGNTRRTSAESIPKLTDQNESLLEEMRRLQQERNQQILTSNESVKQELKLEIREIGSRLDKIENEVGKINGKIKSLENDMRRVENKVESIDRERSEDQSTILRILVKQRENCKKLKGLKENVNENLYTLLCPILAKFINESEEQFPWEVDRVYRINSRIARVRNVPRDMVVYFVRKQTRDLIINQSYRNKLIIDDQVITILKDVPGPI